ncbi:3-phosphoshikimate 1-carboxyvinyltransferase [Rathayibacter soli]|uniref:3-phosphoshikimate 1-carboxyvinyltransferase n=1 Tax=Rathayibacter soli TaxID=3144168 RepID=UPI0027E3CC1A|nr:3-phosphoshikimate 1-carboxyvinyltransferase [Glaciibacter superstes]
MQLIVHGAESRLAGELEIPVSKYHAHRALVLASLAEGTSVVSGVSATRQVEWTISVLRALGTDIRIVGDDYLVTGGRYRATDVDENGTHGSNGLLNVGSSGTTLYFMTGLASLADRPMTLTGMKYFRRRPISALLGSLQQMGVELTSTDGCPPITVQPVRPRGGDVEIAGTLSQWLSGLLLLAPFARSDTTVHVTGGALNEQPYVDLTVRMMRTFGLVVEHDDDWLTYRIPGNQTATPADYRLPPDIGAAAFGVAATALHPSDVLFRGLSATRAADTDHPESEFLDLAARMGVPMRLDDATGFVRVQHDGIRLNSLDIDCAPIPDLLPVLSAMASVADGTSRLRNIGHIRLKESDRVSAMLQLNRMGASAQQSDSELRITGVEALRAAALSSFNDHRVLMALAVAATRAGGSSSLTYPHAYRISYPEFLDAMNGIGLEIDVSSARQPDTGDPNSGYATGADTDRLTAQSAGRTAARRSSVSDAEYRYGAFDRHGPVEHVLTLSQERPDDPAVIEVGADAPAVVSWSDLQREADQVSALLLDLGVRRGEAVAVQLPNWREFMAITLGIIQLGAVVTPIMPAFGPRETTMTLARSHARVLFLPNLFRHRRPAIELLDVSVQAHRQSRPLALEHVVVLQTENRHSADVATDLPPIPDSAAAMVETVDWTWHYYDAALASVTPDLPHIRSRAPHPDDVCQLLFTSGTTGEPKGVQHTHGTLARAVDMEIAHLGLDGDDRIFVPSPLAHQTGFLYGMLLSWQLGVAAVIQPVWDAPLALEQGFGLGKATFVQAATPFLMDLVREVETGAHAPQSLRIFVATGAAVPRALAQQATAVLGTAVLGAFGTTETCLGTLASPDDAPERAWGNDGRALAGIDIRIVDDAGMPVAAGAEGNFELRSPTIFGGYLERPDLTADVFTSDGWYRTGDLASVDDEGFLRISGRVKDVINRGGEKVPVVEVENLLYQHPLVADVAVVAMPDARLGERACAFVVSTHPDRPLTFRALQQYLAAAGVSKYYWPERLEFVDELPRNAIGKIQKNILREMAAALVAATKETI